MANNSLLIYKKEIHFNFLHENNWTTAALASCQTLKLIGAYLCFVFIFGILLNSFVIYTIIKGNTLRSPINVFFIALSISDLSHALLAIPLPLTSNFACR